MIYMGTEARPGFCLRSSALKIGIESARSSPAMCSSRVDPSASPNQDLALLTFPSQPATQGEA